MINWQNLLTGSSVTPTQTTTPGNPNASSVSQPVFGVTPYIAPSQQPAFFDQFSKLLSDYRYSPSAGGYLSSSDASNANSFYNKFGGGSGDPTANQAVGEFYKTLGNLPTAAVTSPALTKLNLATGAQPTLGPSLNSTLAKLLESPVGAFARKAGFGSSFEGPFNIPNY